MELYLDSANFSEIEEAFTIGGISGLTTTPTFMHKEGVKDIDSTILKLAKLVPVLQIEALGSDVDSIVTEANRLVALGLDPSKTVFKIPVSLAGIKACYRLRKAGLLVNVHLVYTIQQAYMAITAGATYVCPLVGRLQDQGHDALALVADCVDVVENYGYDAKIMFSSVRTVDHVRDALQVGAHACTVPWPIMKNLTENHFTKIGTKEFFEHTNLIMLKVKNIATKAPKVSLSNSLNEGLIEMTRSKLGAVAIVDENNLVKGVFTDGDLRRIIETSGSAKLDVDFSSFDLKPPITISPESTLNEALQLFKEKQIDTLIVSQDNQYCGMLDIQELLLAVAKF